MEKPNALKQEPTTWASPRLYYSVCAAALMLLLAMLVSERGHGSMSNANIATETASCKSDADRGPKGDCDPPPSPQRSSISDLPAR